MSDDTFILPKNYAGLVYLAGPISNHFYEGAVDWRIEAQRFFIQYDVFALNPMRGKGELKGLDRPIASAFDQIPGPKSPIRTPRAIFRRDRWDVYRCDVVLANFEPTAVVDGVQKASIGTCMEIAWADAFMKPVIAVIPEDNVHDHSLIKEACTVIVPTLQEAMEYTLVVMGG